MIIDVSPAHSTNANSSIRVNEGGMTIVVRLLKFNSPISVTESGMTIDLRLVQSENVPSSVRVRD